MSCHPCRGIRFLWVLLCILTLSLPVKAAQINADEVYCFTQTDFSAQESILTGVCITALPDSARGTVRLGSRVIRAGDVLTSGQLDQMVFSPVRSDSDATAEVSYLPIYTTGLAPEATMVISIHGKEDKAPAALDSSLETYKNLPNEGILKVTDPEEQALTYTLGRQPKRGEVVLRPDGSFLYTPKNNKVGTDSFTYTATDPAGNVSREATVTVKILKPADDARYTDTAGLSCQFAAEWMRNTGIFAGESVGGQTCFSPDKAVSRGQFLAMLMQTLDMPVDSTVTATGFIDDAPGWMKPYLAAALRSGLVSGYPCQGGSEFRPDQAITGDEAATMIRNALDFAVPTLSDTDGAAAAWAQEAAAAIRHHGITLPEGNQSVTRSDTALVLYQINRLQEENPGLVVFFRQ